MIDSGVGGVSTGELLDQRYRLIEHIGAGGAARVYRAEDEHLQRMIAIKVMRGHVDGLGSVERARAETLTLASLSHPCLVTLFDARIATSEDEPTYLVMEYVPGVTLRDRKAQGPMDAAELAGIAVDIAEGMHVAHIAGVVHRDIKPSNVLLWRSPLDGERWRAKLADFGIAYLQDSTRATEPGLVLGTAAYLAPEQARGETPAPPADIYAFGIMLIEALTGVRPWADAEGIGTLMARLMDPPPVPETLPQPWWSLLRRMTAMRPEDRPTALEVATAAAQLTGAGRGAGAAGNPVGAAVAAAAAAPTATDQTTQALVPADASGKPASADPPTAPLSLILPPSVAGETATRVMAPEPGGSPGDDGAAPPTSRRRRLIVVAVVVVLLLALAGTGIAALSALGPAPTPTSPAVDDPAPVVTPTEEEPAPVLEEEPAPVVENDAPVVPVEPVEPVKPVEKPGPAEDGGPGNNGNGGGPGNDNRGPGNNNGNGGPGNGNG